MATFGLFRLAQVVTPKMKERQKGNIIVTSATSAVRGNKGQHSHAAAMGGRRMLCQSLNAEFAKDGIHVAELLKYVSQEMLLITDLAITSSIFDQFL